jgi:hypothetical protein
MIQRVQTLYLSIAAIASVLMFFFPITKYFNDVQGTYVFFITGIKYMIDPPLTVQFWHTFPLLLLVACSLILVVAAIFQYRKRILQLWFVNIAFLLHVVLILLIFLYYINHFETLFNTNPSYQFGIFIPLVSLVCIILASRAIRKDEAMVKSADRLR